MKKLLLTLNTLSILNGAEEGENYFEKAVNGILLEIINEHPVVFQIKEKTPHDLALEKFWNTPEHRRQTIIEHISPVWIKRYYIDDVMVAEETIF